MIWTLLIFATLAGGAQPTAPASIARLAWLSGCWEELSSRGTIEEQWTSPRAGTMLGTGRTVRGDTTAEYEFVVLREQDGRLAYEAHPSRQSPAVFMSSGVEGGRVVFENPEHDFPQRVGYERHGTDALLAWIEGTPNGASRRIEFRYRRVSCSASAADASGDVEHEIRTLEKQWNDARAHADVVTLDRLLADDWTVTHGNGTTDSKAQYLFDLKSGARAFGGDITESELSVRVYGDTAIVTGSSDSTVTLNGRPQGGALHFTRVYMKRNGAWKMVVTQATTRQQ